MQVPLWMVLKVRFAYIMLAFLALGCRKQDANTPEQQAIKQHKQDLKNEKARFSHLEKAFEKKGGPSTMDALAYTVHLMQTRQLPWASNGGALVTDDITTVSTRYPLERTFFLYGKKGHPFSYHYIVTKASANESWHLRRAWKTDAQTNIIEDSWF
jgi:hypothetical protein